MRIRTVIFCSLVFITMAWHAPAQQLSNLRQRTLSVAADTIRLDTLSIVPESFFLVSGGLIISDTALYTLDIASATFIWKKGFAAYAALATDSVLAVYRVFPVLFSKFERRRSADVIERKYGGVYNPSAYLAGEKGASVFKFDGLSKTGSISRGIRFGNSQDVVVNSSLNLQLAGKLQDDVEILAAITDNNIPVQPEGNTQQLNEFDKVFIQLSKNRSKLIAGDFDLTRPASYFMNFNKKGQGGLFSTAFRPSKSMTDSIGSELRVTASGAVSKGKYARNVINGIEANQGPYRLRGAENELFIVVLSGSEKVYIDGVAMTRGQEYDYVIDYNTAELIFTPRRIISRDKRIVIEFQYSDKNYARSLVFANTEYDTHRVKLKMNVYSEQDSKNQPLLQDLSDEQKLFLANKGDSVQNAFYENIDSVAFNINEVLYERIDSAGFTFYRYSTDSSKAHYRLGFSNVGAGNGNYSPVTSSANGKVFEWKAPVGGVPQGDYEAVTLLIAPRQQQMATLGAEYALGPTTKITAEGAFSNYNVNLFSKTGKADDKGYAINTALSHVFSLDTLKEKGWKLNTGLRYELVNKNFVPIETFRNIEFTRDWNLAGINARDDEHSAAVTVGLQRDTRHRLQYELKSFSRGSQYRGLVNMLSGHSQAGKYRMLVNGSYLQTTGDLSKSSFIRGNADLSRTFSNRFVAGIRTMAEHNRLFFPGTDSLLPGSFYNHTQTVYFSNADTTAVKFRADYSRRFDYGVKYNDLRNATIADDATAAIEWTPGDKTRLAFTGNFRRLSVTDTLLAPQSSDDNLLNRVEYRQTALKGGLIYNMFYEVGTGQELKREFSYVKVTDGTGVYAWKDYNGDGIPQLNEFETAAFKDEANYIRVFLPVDEFVKSRFNQISQSLSLNPAAISARNKKAGRLVSRFAGQFSMRLSNKTTSDNLGQSLNPFDNRVSDSLLVSVNSAYRNTVYFNRTSSHFGMDVSMEENRNKSLLTNGFEARTLKKFNSNIRWNLTPAVAFNEFAEQGKKENSSEFFTDRDYTIDYYSTESKIHIQPGSLWRLTFLYLHKNKKNDTGEQGERSLQHKGGIEVRYSSVKKGILTAAFNMIRNSYNADENSPLAYEMLEGLKAGTNYTWNASLLRNLSGNVQMSLNYDGRISEGSGAIHTGGVEVRAFF